MCKGVLTFSKHDMMPIVQNAHSGCLVRFSTLPTPILFYHIINQLSTLHRLSTNLYFAELTMHENLGLNFLCPGSYNGLLRCCVHKNTQTTHFQEDKLMKRDLYVWTVNTCESRKYFQQIIYQIVEPWANYWLFKQNTENRPPCTFQIRVFPYCHMLAKMCKLTSLPAPLCRWSKWKAESSWESFRICDEATGSQDQLSSVRDRGLYSSLFREKPPIFSWFYKKTRPLL